MRFYGELLIFFLLLITNARVLFVKHEKRDSLVVLAPLSLFLVILQILAWGIDVLNIYALVLSVLILLSNFHALFRYSERVYVDHYSILMKFWAVITNFLSIVGIIASCFFMPIHPFYEKIDVTESQLRYEGSFRTGFSEASHFAKSAIILNEYTKTPQLSSRPDVVLFIPDKRANTENYVPFLQQLSDAGFTICSADFYCEDGRWLYSSGDNKLSRRFVMVIKSLINPVEFNSQREFYTYNTSLELNALIPLLDERYGEKCRYFLLGDVMAETAIKDYFKLHPQKIRGFFSLSEIPEYKTAGYGCVTQTDLLLAYILREKRDINGEVIHAMVEKTDYAIKSAWGIETSPQNLPQVLPETSPEDLSQN